MIDIISIRKATINDANDYAIILNKSWKDTYGEYITFEHIDDEFNIDKLIEGFPDYLKGEGYDLYMITKDGENIGILELGVYDEQYKEDMTGIGEIRSFHIKKEYHKQGIGKLALDFAINDLQNRGYSIACLWVKKQNINAIGFYEKYGFHKTIYTTEAPADGAPSMIMEKNIKAA